MSLAKLLHYVKYKPDERWCNRCYDARTNDPDALLHIRDAIRGDACRGSHDADDVRNGKSNSGGGDDGKRSSDASTSHTTSSYVRTTNSGNIPNTKDCSMRTKRLTRTNHILPDGKRKQVL